MINMSQVSKKTLNIRGKLYDISTPKVMGIVNITNNSFYENSRIQDVEGIVDRVGLMLEEGADMVDIGGYSTRPGAEEVVESEEIDRVLGAVEPLLKFYPELIISIDTFRSQVAEHAVQAGAHLVNDVSGGTLDPDMFDTVAKLHVPYVLMHMRGNPKTMNSLTTYEELVTDVLQDLGCKLSMLHQKGVADVLIDPGFGFAKTTAQNFEIMQKLEEFQMFGLPLLIGISRKRMIYQTLGGDAGDALNGTTVLNTISLGKGASVLRVHDVKEAKEAVKLFQALQG
jgi:dihydropteroate synthase